MTDLKPIETVYDGYRFRSRLEARWAVFFDALGIRYEYEKEGFDLGAAGWYLPDFFLPGYRCWAEIKGAEPTAEEALKVDTLVLAGGLPAFLFRGLPRWDYEYGYDGYPKKLIVDGEIIRSIEIEDWYRLEAAADPDEFGGLARVSLYLKYGRIPVRFSTTDPVLPFFGVFDFSDHDFKRALNRARGARFG